MGRKGDSGRGQNSNAPYRNRSDRGELLGVGFGTSRKEICNPLNCNKFVSAVSAHTRAGVPTYILGLIPLSEHIRFGHFCPHGAASCFSRTHVILYLLLRQPALATGAAGRREAFPLGTSMTRQKRGVVLQHHTVAESQACFAHSRLPCPASRRGTSTLVYNSQWIPLF